MIGSRAPLKVFLYANAIIGLLVVIANGAAVALVFAGRGGAVSDRVPEMVAWCIGGLLLLAAGAYAYFRPSHVLPVLRFQMFVVLALVIAVAGRAIIALSRASAVDARLVWGVGFFTLLVIYAVALVSRVLDSDRYLWLRRALLWIGVPAAVLLDVAMALRG